MRPLVIGLAIFSAACLLFVACSQDSTSAATGTSGTGGAPNCDGIVIVNGEDAGNTCDVCLHKECCAEVAACADKYCKDCVNFLSSGCSSNPHVNALNDCVGRRCDSTCNPKWTPITSSSTASGS
jgi:hypothetical protein